MLNFRPSIASDLPRVMDIWRAAVDATHDFLDPGDRDAIEAELLEFFPQVSLLLAVNSSDAPLGFMFLHDGHLEALFVAPDHHGKGIGKALIRNVLAAHPNLTVDVNEQNPKALGFYEHLDFERIGRSAQDGQGRPYPLIHLRRRADS
ncbi:putative N-acetyltransferase YjaB [compost metagenome]